MDQQSTRSRNPVVLMVDDDVDDVYFAKRAFKSHQSDLIFNSVSDRFSLFDYLNRRGSFAHLTVTELPKVILLDINMPKENGFEILKQLKADPECKHIPVTMFTTSTAKNDIRKAYELGASSFISKSVSTQGMKRVAQKYCDYWFELVQAPQDQ